MPSSTAPNAPVPLVVVRTIPRMPKLTSTADVPTNTVESFLVPWMA